MGERLSPVGRGQSKKNEVDGKINVISSESYLNLLMGFTGLMLSGITWHSSTELWLHHLQPSLSDGR